MTSEELDLAQSAGQPITEAPVRRYAVLIRRLVMFNAIGLFVFVAGTGLQWATVRPLGAVWSYGVQAVFSVELSWVLNRWLTWGDRNAGSTSLARWNAQRVASIVINYLAYLVLLHAGIDWLWSNVMVTVAFVPVNYVLGDVWSFARRQSAVTPRESAPLGPGWLPTVSVVIPCKNNPSTIRATVESFLDQGYQFLTEVIVVGDVGDPTWASLAHLDDPRLILVEHREAPDQREPNIKRHEGILKSSGELVALADSDIVMEPDWLAKGIALLGRQGNGLVAGGMYSVHDSFWGRFVDTNLIAAKTPRLPRPYRVTAANFGRRGYKPPISANAIFFREMYDETELDHSWFYGYEDYEWFWRVAKAGHVVTFDGALNSAHHHRRSYRSLLREYAFSSEGCARFIRRHPDSPLARKRLLQGVLLPPLFVGCIAGAGWVAAAGYGLYLAAAGGAACVALAARELARTRRLEAIAYPFVGLSLAAAFTFNLTKSLIMPVAPATAVTQTWENAARTQRRGRWRVSWPLAAILAIQSAFSLSLVWSNSAFADEANYLTYGRLELLHWLHGSPLPAQGFSGAPQIYMPVGAIANMVGGLAAARILSLIFMLLGTVMLYQIGVATVGRLAALSACALFAVSEPVVRLAFATYDAMACMFIIGALWIASRVPRSKFKGELVALSAAALALGSVTAFSFAIYSPVVIALAFLIWQPEIGTRLATWCAAWLTAASLFGVIALMTPLHLWQTAITSTVARGTGGGLGTPVTSVISAAWSWDGLLFAAACGGAIIAFCTERAVCRKLLIPVCALAAAAAPVYEAHIGTGWSLDKHMSAGTAFAALAAGYGLSRLFKMSSLRAPVAVAVSVAFLFYPAAIGLWYAHNTFRSWPSTATLASYLRAHTWKGDVPIIGAWQGTYWSVQYEIPSLHAKLTAVPAEITSGAYPAVVLTLDASISSPGLTRDAIAASPGAAVQQDVLRLAANNPGEFQFASLLEKYKEYKIVATIPYETSVSGNASGLYVVWQRIGGPG
jgi:putative flippase GtrA